MAGIDNNDGESRLEREARTRLDAVVRGAVAFVDVEFDGPATAYIGTDPHHMYHTLCSHGIKAQGEFAPSYDTAQEAIELYGDQLRRCVKSNEGKMLAWRCRPSLTNEAGRYRVYSRLVFI